MECNPDDLSEEYLMKLNAQCTTNGLGFWRKNHDAQFSICRYYSFYRYYKYYKSYVDIECNNKLTYVDNTNYIPSEMDIENFGMYEGYTHFANMLIANFKSDDEVLNNIRTILKDDDNLFKIKECTAWQTVHSQVWMNNYFKSMSVNKK